MTFCWITIQPVLQQQFKSSVKTALNALNMMSNVGGLRVSKKYRLPGYKFWVWFSKRAITNIICLKNLIKIYRVTYDSEVGTTLWSIVLNLDFQIWFLQCTLVGCICVTQRR